MGRPSSLRSESTTRSVRYKCLVFTLSPLTDLRPCFRSQDSMDPTVGQYWANITAAGIVTIPRVKPGKYRLTCYASGRFSFLPRLLSSFSPLTRFSPPLFAGVFGDYVYDNVVIKAGQTTSRSWSWSQDQNGAEIFRIGGQSRTRLLSSLSNKR